MNFEDIKTKFVKNKLKGLDYNESNKEYISTLMSIEGYVLGGNVSSTRAVRMHHILQEYKEEHEAIWSELKPEEFKAWKEKEARVKKKQEDANALYERRDKEEEKETKNSWEQMGGKV